MVEPKALSTIFGDSGKTKFFHAAQGDLQFLAEAGNDFVVPDFLSPLRHKTPHLQGVGSSRKSNNRVVSYQKSGNMGASVDRGPMLARLAVGC